MPELLPQLENEPKPKLSELLEKYIHGDSHEHTVFKEGAYSFEQIFNYVREEMKEGENQMEFVIFTEHPSDAGDPQEVSGQELLMHQAEIHKFNLEQEDIGEDSPKLISGVEADIISPEGKVNVPNEVLAQMDFVIASKHGGLEKFFGGNPSAEQLKTMYVGLMQNPNVDVIGHPNRYVEYKTMENIDWDGLLSLARETKTAFEINVNASMPEWLIKKVVQAGVPICIGTDAHSLREYQNLPNEIQVTSEFDRLKHPLGVKYSFWKKMSKILRTVDEAGAPPEQIINSSLGRLENWLSEEKKDRIISWQNAQT